MSLSISKLEDLLISKNFAPKRYFVLNKYCLFVEVININNSTTFMLSIPSKYKFKLKEGESVYSLKIIESLDSISNSPIEDYTKEPTDKFMENNYIEVELTNKLLRTNNDEQEGNIAGHLEEGYKKQLSLKDISKDDKNDIKDLVRQLKRLKYCTQSIGYKLIIFYMNYLCVLDKDESIECFFIKQFNKIHSRRLLVSVNLELFYENKDRIVQDITDIENGIYRVFDKNQENHIKNLSKLLQEQIHISDYTKSILIKRKEYNNYIEKFNSLLIHLNLSENTITDKINELNRDTSNNSIHSNTFIVNQKSKLDDELNQLFNTKNNIIKNIRELRNRQEDMLLKVDKIMFDNLVMMASIMKNIEVLKTYT